MATSTETKTGRGINFFPNINLRNLASRFARAEAAPISIETRHQKEIGHQLSTPASLDEAEVNHYHLLPDTSLEDRSINIDTLVAMGQAVLRADKKNC